MLQINIYLKFAIIAVSFILGIVLWAMYGFWYSSFFWLVGLIFLGSYILLGTIQSAAEMVQKQDFEGAEQRLKLTAFPNLLYVSNRAFYYIISGTIAMNKNNVNEAEELFNKALSLDLPTDTEKGMVLIQLASINANKGKWKVAENYYKQAKSMNINEPMIKQQMAHLDQAFKQKGQIKAARRMGKQGHQMVGRGGKRRRPKMR